MFTSARCLCFPYDHCRSSQCLVLVALISKALHNLLFSVVTSLSLLTQYSRLAHASYLHPTLILKQAPCQFPSMLVFPCRCLAMLNLSWWLKPNPSAFLLTLCLHVCPFTHLCHEAYRNTLAALILRLLSTMLSHIISLSPCTSPYANVFSFLLFLSFKAGSLVFAVLIQHLLQYSSPELGFMGTAVNTNSFNRISGILSCASLLSSIAGIIRGTNLLLSCDQAILYLSPFLFPAWIVPS